MYKLLKIEDSSAILITHMLFSYPDNSRLVIKPPNMPNYHTFRDAQVLFFPSSDVEDNILIPQVTYIEEHPEYIILNNKYKFKPYYNG